MSVSESDRKIVDRLFKAMQAGPAGAEEMLGLFASDAVMIEPFSGEPQTHEGKAAIEASFKAMFEDPAPDLKLMLDRLDLDGDNVRADWTCTSPVFPTPMKGHDLFQIEDGAIKRLEIVITEMPPMDPH